MRLQVRHAIIFSSPRERHSHWGLASADALGRALGHLATQGWAVSGSLSHELSGGRRSLVWTIGLSRVAVAWIHNSRGDVFVTVSGEVSGDVDSVAECLEQGIPLVRVANDERRVEHD